MVHTAPDMKKRRMGSRRIYLLRVMIPMSKTMMTPARAEAEREPVSCHTVRKEKGTMAQPRRVQPSLIPSQLWSRYSSPASS